MDGDTKADAEETLSLWDVGKHLDRGGEVLHRRSGHVYRKALADDGGSGRLRLEHRPRYEKAWSPLEGSPHLKGYSIIPLPPRPIMLSEKYLRGGGAGWQAMVRLLRAAKWWESFRPGTGAEADVLRERFPALDELHKALAAIELEEGGEE